MSWESSFLNWFATQGIPIAEHSLFMGELRYFHFSSALSGTYGKRIYSMGCSTDRELAAVKCAAETIERKFMDEFFSTSRGEISAEPALITAQGLAPLGRDTDLERAPIPLAGMRTSNGWAVHSNEESARESAWKEALERHLLIKSFYRWGWSGFKLIQEVENEGIHLFFMTSRLQSAGYIAGIVGVKWPDYPGASFGYCVGKVERVSDASFWYPALFEATSRIQLLSGRSIEIQENANTWLQSEAKHYLESPLESTRFLEGKDFESEDDDDQTCFIKTFDLSRIWGLDFPLKAAFCWGGNLIPLCDQSKLDPSGVDRFHSTLRRNNLSLDIPKRHPIL